MSGIILGSGLAYMHPSAQAFNLVIFLLAIGTTLCLQILSNLANELGDAQKGTDRDQHEREAYGLQAGTITVRQMKGMIWLYLGLSVIFGSILIFIAFGSFRTVQSWVFLGLGLLAIVGAVTYTLGKHNYGYVGLGDVGVLVFFGLLSTMGAYYLQTQTMCWEVFWCSVAIGLPCVGVLNLNNIRDMSNDRAHGKRTIAGKLGPVGARVYHYLLLFCCLLIFVLTGHYWTCLIVPVWAWHAWYIGTHTKNLDKQMPVLMFSTLVVAILGIF